MGTGVVFLVVIVAFCICLGFAVATAIMYRREIQMLKKVTTVNSNVIADVNHELQQMQGNGNKQPDVDLSQLMDSEGMSALMDAMAKAGK